MPLNLGFISPSVHKEHMLANSSVRDQESITISGNTHTYSKDFQVTNIRENFKCVYIVFNICRSVIKICHFQDISEQTGWLFLSS